VQTAALEEWRWLTLDTCRTIIRHIEYVEELRAKGTAASQPHLAAYPCYGCSYSCPYSDLCIDRCNPESYPFDEPPPDGFEENTWSPFPVEEVLQELSKGEST